MQSDIDLYIEYKNKKYVKLIGDINNQKKLFNLLNTSDILMLISDDEYDTLKSLYEESGRYEFLQPWVVFNYFNDFNEK